MNARTCRASRTLALISIFLIDFSRSVESHRISHGPESGGEMLTTASARWTDEERFVGIASSGHAIVADSGDHKTANGPMELVLIGLCSCTATDIVNILRKK